MKRYEEYKDKPRNGTHGKTAKFWFGYVEKVQLYHQFIRSIRTGNLDLYIYCLPELSNFFFAFNHHNYARWLVIYYDNLLKLKDMHLQVNEDFQNGCFALKRTSKPFSRIPIALTFEQTINADDACQRIGITTLTNSISARQRWAQSHSVIVTIVSQVLEEMGLTGIEELKPHRMSQNSQGLNTLINAIAETMNPLSQTIEKRVATRNPHTIDITIIDGMFFLHLFVELPPTFGALAKFILRQVCRQKGNEIHLVFDKAISPSIKDCQRNKRGDNRVVAYQITGPEQKRPGNWLQALRVDQFKEA